MDAQAKLAPVLAQASSLHKALQSLAAELEGGDKKRLEGLEKELATT